MSMSSYAVYGYGFVLADDEVDAFMECNAIEGEDDLPKTEVFRANFQEVER